MAEHKVSVEGNLRPEVPVTEADTLTSSGGVIPLWDPLVGIALGLIVIGWFANQRRLTV